MPSSINSQPHLPNLRDRGSTVVSILLLMLIVGSAWQYGGQTHQAQCAILIALGLIIVVFKLGHPSGIPKEQTLPFPIWICLTICVLSLSQCVALPIEWVSVLSPGVSEVWTQWIPETLLTEASQSNDPQLSRLAVERRSSQPATIDPWLTKLALFKPLAFGITLWLSASIRWGIWNVTLLFGGISLAGCALTFFGLADAITLARDWQPELRNRLWITPIGADSPFGVFVNSNNAAGFLHLCMGASIGLFTLTSSHGQSSTGHLGIHRFSKISIALISIGILGTQSRGAAIALALAGIVFLIQAKRQRTRLYYLAVSFAVVFSGIGLFNEIGTGEVFRDRIESVFDGRSFENPRIEHWNEAMRAAVHFFPFGSGLGTYRYAYLPYQESSSDGWHVHADGMPVEWLVEGGLWLTILVLLGWIWWFRMIRKLRTLPRHGSDWNDVTHQKLSDAISRSLTYLLVTLTITQCFDFAILLPSVFLPLAVLLGILDHCARRRQHGESQDPACGRSTLRFYSIQRTTVATTFLILGVMTTLNLREASWMDGLEFESRTNRRTAFDEWKSFETELAQMEDLASPRILKLGTQGGRQHSMLLSSLRIRQQQFVGLQALRQLTASGVVDADIVTPKMLATPILRRAIHQQRKTRAETSPHNFMLDGQDYDQYLQSRKDAITALLKSPLADRPRLRLIELDFCSDIAQPSSDTLKMQTLILRPNHKTISAYLDSLRGED